MIDIPTNYLNVADILPISAVNGPGKRFVIWLQGCSLRCEGCINQHLWEFRLNHLMSIEEILSLIEQEITIDGITLSGGEPLHQGKELLKLVHGVKERDLSVMIYSGYYPEEVSDPIAKQLLERADILILGPFMKEFASSFLKLRGSKNQLVVMNNRAYQKYFYSDQSVGDVEIHINENGGILLTGFPDKNFVDEVLK